MYVKNYIFTFLIQRIAISLFTLIFSQHIAYGQPTYEVYGNISGLPAGTKLFLENLNFSLVHNKQEIIDSATYKKSFVFRGVLKELAFCRIFDERGKVNIRFILERGKTCISVYSKDRILISGGLQNKKLNILRQRESSIDKKQDYYSRQAAKYKGQDTSRYKSYKDSIKWTRNVSESLNNDFCKNNPDAFISLYLLNGKKLHTPKKELKKIFSNFSIQLKSHSVGRYLKSYINSDTMIYYVDIIQPDINGNEFKLSSIMPKYILLDFWASWCGPCRKSNPQLIELYKKYGGKNVEFVSISLDTDKNKWKEAIIKDSLQWVHVSTLDGWNNSAAIEYGIVGVPEYFIIDPNSKIILRTNEIEELINKFPDFIEERL